MMTISTQTTIGFALAQALSTAVVRVPAAEATTWIFGGCAPDQHFQAYIDAAAAVNGLTDKSDLEACRKFLTFAIGSKFANDAMAHIDEE